MNRITSEELKRKMDEDKDILVVNVLPKSEFDKKHIPHSINIPVMDEAFIEKFEKKASDKEQEIVVYCASLDCPASSTAAGKLEKAGYSNVIDFEKGIKDWEDKGYPVQGKSTA